MADIYISVAGTDSHREEEEEDEELQETEAAGSGKCNDDDC